MSDVLHSVCALDCPDCCALLVTVSGGRATKLRGDPAHPALANMSFAALTVLLACLTCSLSLAALLIRTPLFP